MVTDNAVFDGVGNITVPPPSSGGGSGAGTARKAIFDNVGAGAPATVPGLQISNLTTTSFTVSWPASVGAANYRLVLTYANGDGFNDSFIDSYAGLLATITTSILSWTFTPLTPATAYAVSIQPLNGTLTGGITTVPVSTAAVVDPTQGGTVTPPAPPPVVVTPSTSVQPIGEAFPAGRVFRPANELLTFTEATA